MQEKRNTTETIKSIAIVVLFLTAILLLYLSWGDRRLESLIANRDENAAVLPLSAAVLPSRAFLSMGDGSYALGDSEKARLFFTSLGELSSGEELLMEEITREQYFELRAGESVFFDYDYYLPFSEYLEALGIAKIAGSENLEALSQAVFAGGEDKTLCFRSLNMNGDPASERYFRINADGTEKAFEAFENERTAEAAALSGAGENICYTLDTYLGESALSKVPVPVFLNAELEKRAVRPEISAEDTEGKDKYAQSFFGKNFDFVRKIEEESGRIIYMYGYGERTLISETTGSFEYRREDDGSEGIRYFEALERALTFIAEHGGFDSLNGKHLRPFLEYASAGGSGRRSFSFSFGLFTEDGERVYSADYSPLTIELSAGKVVYFRRSFFERAAGASREENEAEPQLSAVNMLAASYMELAERFGASYGVDMSAITELEDFAPYITSLDFGYLRASSGSELIPCWVLGMNSGGKAADFYLPLDEQGAVLEGAIEMRARGAA